jgi:hypothetical protein
LPDGSRRSCGVSTRPSRAPAYQASFNTEKHNAHRVTRWRSTPHVDPRCSAHRVTRWRSAPHVDPWSSHLLQTMLEARDGTRSIFLHRSATGLVHDSHSRRRREHHLQTRLEARGGSNHSLLLTRGSNRSLISTSCSRTRLLSNNGSISSRSPTWTSLIDHNLILMVSVSLPTIVRCSMTLFST